MCSLIKSGAIYAASANHAANTSNTQSIPLIYRRKMLIGVVSEPAPADMGTLVSAEAMLQ